MILDLVMDNCDVGLQIAFRREDVVADETGDGSSPLVNVLDVSPQVAPRCR